MDINDIGELGKVGIIPQKQKDYYVIRIKSVAGDISAEHLEVIAGVAQTYADGQVHLSTRQGIELHNIQACNVILAKNHLEARGVELGASGSRVRGVTACPGASTCPHGIINTKDVARELDRMFFGQEAPGKFKIAVCGCPNNCAKPVENDVGVMGGVLPQWVEDQCIDCQLCSSTCPVEAISCNEEGRYIVNEERCILCGICINSCPADAWDASKKGYTLFLGGTMGKKPRLGTRFARLIQSKEELFLYIEQAFAFYKEYGKKKERFGHTLERLGMERYWHETRDGD
ncbi:MAG TPA: 4Fe-4S binding protein [Syntrophomonadaceae bacterium]|nr:4Fe-4S binding protein [Syntrophomonadaceae bacterium]